MSQCGHQPARRRHCADKIKAMEVRIKLRALFAQGRGTFDGAIGAMPPGFRFQGHSASN